MPSYRRPVPGPSPVWELDVDLEQVSPAVNTIGDYSRTVPLPGPTVLVITANGPWSIRPG